VKRFTTFIRNGLLAIAFLGVAVSATVGTAAVVSAAGCTGQGCVQQGVNQVGGNQAGNSANDFTKLIKSIINILLFLIGAIAVIMIIIGGIRYTTSNGDQAQVTSAKNTILYAVVGLVVAIMAFALVNFILNAL